MSECEFGFYDGYVGDEIDLDDLSAVELREVIRGADYIVARVTREDVGHSFLSLVDPFYVRVRRIKAA